MTTRTNEVMHVSNRSQDEARVEVDETSLYAVSRLHLRLRVSSSSASEQAFNLCSPEPDDESLAGSWHVTTDDQGEGGVYGTTDPAVCRFNTNNTLPWSAFRPGYLGSRFRALKAALPRVRPVPSF